MVRARARRWLASAFSILMVSAVLSPAQVSFSDDRSDSFPLSWYPMFRGVRPAVEKPVYVIGLTDDGTRHKVNYRHWAVGGFNQSRRQLGRVVKQGPERLERACADIASRISERHRGWRTRVDTVRVVQGRYSRTNYFVRGLRAPMDERVLVECPVLRAPPQAVAG